MSNKIGVSAIEGNRTPVVGVKTVYNIKSWYPATPAEKRNPALVTWELFKLRDNGQFTSTNIKKQGIGEFTFGERAAGNRYRIEGYLVDAEMRMPMSIEVLPHSAAKPKIERVLLLDAAGKKIAGPLHYAQRITAQVHTTGMIGKTVKISLWEDDANGAGHSNRNMKNFAVAYNAIVKKNGVASGLFTLSPNFSAIANASGDGAKDKIHEYYVTAEYWVNGKLQHYKSSANEEVSNPLYRPSAAANKPGKPKKQEKGIIDSLGESIGSLADWLEDKLTVKPVIKPDKPQAPGNRPVVVSPQEKGTTSCGEKFCIKKGTKNELIREINIRLSGFGGNVPTDEFTDRTEKMIKQFQTDYMKIPATGRICGNTLRAVDEFNNKFPVKFEQVKCKCKKCSGFGSEQFAEQFNDAGIAEMRRKYEYPGIHRSLIWTLKAVMFYLSDIEKGLGLRVGPIFSAYRCWEDNKQHNRTSTNHMGKAFDIHIYKTTDQITTEANCDKVRDLMKKYCGAQDRWAGSDRISLEPSTRIRIGKEFIATTWVHYDVREFGLPYKLKRFFVKTNASALGDSILNLAKAAGYTETCSCMGAGNKSKAAVTSQAEEGRKEVSSLKTSQKGIDFIRDWEQFEPRAYNDAEGYCTIGYGHLIDYKRCENITLPNEFKNGITKEEAVKLFNRRLPEFENGVKRDIKVKLYQHEFDALVSLLFNAGENFLNTGGAGGGETKIKKQINNGAYNEGADEMADVTNNGLSGLVKRRKAEINMFKNNVYDSTH